MILRSWRGAVRAEDASEYLRHQDETGVRDYRETPGNRGAWVLSRDLGDRVEVVTMSLWDSLESIIGFAGDPPERARFYDGDDDYLVEKDATATHYEVVSIDLPPPAGS